MSTHNTKLTPGADERMGSPVGEDTGTTASSMASLRSRAANWQAQHRSSYLVVLVLLIAVTFILPGISRGEFHLNIDEAFHATTGLFFADFARDLPLRHPIQYTYRYYAQYPALGLVHWPPFFHLAEGAMFLMFGSSVVAARLTVLLFAIVGLYFWFRIVNQLEDCWTAAASTIMLAGLPILLLYEKSVLLEVPSLALCLASTYYWMLYRKRGDRRSAIRFGIAAGLALVTKQQSIYLVPLCLITLAPRNWSYLVRRTTILAVGIVAVISLPFYALCFGVDTKSIAANVFHGVEHVSNPFLYYFSPLRNALGMNLLLLSTAGAVTYVWWRRRKCPAIMFAWICAWYVVFTGIGTKTPRYVVYALPPFIYFAVAPLMSKAIPQSFRRVGIVCVIALLARTSWRAWSYERPYVAGYSSIAHTVTQDPNGSVVLFDGDLSGNFIFFIRAEDARRRFVVLRKALYVTEVMAQFGSEELIHSEQDLDDLINDYGIKYVVIEKNAPIQFHSQKLLRDFLNSGRFRLLREEPIQSNVALWKARSLLLYENTAPAPPIRTSLHLRMLSMNHDIVEPLDGYLNGKH